VTIVTPYQLSRRINDGDTVSTERSSRNAMGIDVEYEVHGDLADPVGFPILGITDNITVWILFKV
jgi:hypothetical protein